MKYKKKWNNVIVSILILTLYVIGLLASSYQGMLYNLLDEATISQFFMIIRHVSFGLPFIFIGWKIMDVGINLKPMKYWVLLLVSSVLWVIEVVLLSRAPWRVEWSMTGFLLPVSICVAILSLQPIKVSINIKYENIRFYSAWIYFTHLIWRNIAKIIWGENVNSLVLFCFSLGFSVISGMITRWCKNQYEVRNAGQ